MARLDFQGSFWKGIGPFFKKAGSPDGLLIICLLFHLYDVIFLEFRQSSIRLGIYIIIAVIAWMTTFRTDPRVVDVADFKIPLILSTLSFLLPYLGNLIPFLQASQFYQWLVVFFPVWVVYVAFAVGGTKLTEFMKWAIIIFWIFLALPTLVLNLSTDLNLTEMETGLNAQQVAVNTWRDLMYNVKRFGAGVVGFFENIPKQFDRLMNYATGGLYASEVEDNKNEPIGVYLEGLESADSRFYEGEEATVWGTIKAKTLNEDIDIILSCYAKKPLKISSEKTEGDITPEKLNVAGEEEEWIDCVFDDLDSGKYEVFVKAEFNFETMSYLKTYYMNKETLRTLKRENVDVLRKYGISHVNPVTVFTNGPLGIGMKSVDPLPVGVYVDDDNVPLFFGISLENRWEGKIKKITKLEVQVHDSLELTNCDHEFEFFETNNEGYNVYHLVPGEDTENITGVHTIRCRLNVVDTESLLGNNPITTRYFRTSAEYIYELEKSVGLEIEEVEGYEAPSEKDEIKRIREDEDVKKECGDSITSCDDYNKVDISVDDYGYRKRLWCEADPCEIENCYWDELSNKCRKKAEEEVEVEVEGAVTQITATENQIANYLQEKAGPRLKDKADAFYKYGVMYGIDPAFAVAVSRKETSLSKNTCGSISQSCNNFFCMKHNSIESVSSGLSTGECGTWASFNSIDEGIEAFYLYIKRGYLERSNPQRTPEEITCATGSGFTTHCYCGTTAEEHDEWARYVVQFREEISSQY